MAGRLRDGGQGTALPCAQCTARPARSGARHAGAPHNERTRDSLRGRSAQAVPSSRSFRRPRTGHGSSGATLATAGQATAERVVVNRGSSQTVAWAVAAKGSLAPRRGSETPVFGWRKKKSPAANGPDVSDIDSQKKAEELFRRGDLEKLFLMPLEFGGADIPQNRLYVPVGMAAIKSGIDNNVIAPLVSAGKVTQYTATPEYQGESFIPIAIKIVASDPGEFSATINIWGEALGRK